MECFYEKDRARLSGYRLPADHQRQYAPWDESTKDRIAPVVAHLENEREFNRPAG